MTITPVYDGTVLPQGDDDPFELGPAKFLWQTEDANGNALFMVLPEGGSVDVPVFVIGDASIEDQDLGWFNGIAQPSLALVDDDKDSYIVFGWLSDDNPCIYPGGSASKIHIKGNVFADANVTVGGDLLGPAAAQFDINPSVAQNILLWGAITSGNPYLILYGWDSGTSSLKYGRFQIDSAGGFSAQAEEILSLQSIGSHVRLLSAAAQPMYFDAGGAFTWRDRDAAYATRMALDSATGLLTIGTGTAGHSPNGLYVVGTSEYDGAAYFDGAVEVTGTLNSKGTFILHNNQLFHIGNSGYHRLLESTADADANVAILELWDGGGGTAVSTMVVGTYGELTTVDIGLFDGLTQPLFAFMDKAGQIKSSTSGTHDGADLDELTETGAFTNAATGDIVRITAGTNVTAGWYWITTKTDNDNVDLDRDFATGANGQADVAYVVYDSTTWIGAEGIKLKTFDGAPGDGNFEIDVDGWVGLDVGQANGRLYWRANDAWHYVNATAGFEVNAKETTCPECGKPMQPGQSVVGMLDEILSDSARHGHWIHLACASRN